MNKQNKEILIGILIFIITIISPIVIICSFKDELGLKPFIISITLFLLSLVLTKKDKNKKVKQSYITFIIKLIGFYCFPFITIYFIFKSCYYVFGNIYVGFVLLVIITPIILIFSHKTYNTVSDII